MEQHQAMEVGERRLFIKPLFGALPCGGADASPSLQPLGWMPTPGNESSPSQTLGCPGQPWTQMPSAALGAPTGWFAGGSLGKTLLPLPTETGSCVQRGAAARETCALYNTSTLCRGNPTPATRAGPPGPQQPPPRPSSLHDGGAATGAGVVGMKSHPQNREMGGGGVHGNVP